MSYQPIEDYGVIGDLHSVALVGKNGSIDWLCFPHFDSPSIFAAILDDKKGGRFAIRAARDGVTTKQFYWPDTNVLVTRFLSPDGVGDIIDFMPAGMRREDPWRHWLIRRVRSVRGTMSFHMLCQPAFNYGRDTHELKMTANGACFESDTLRLGLSTCRELRKRDNAVTADFTLNEGETATFYLYQLPSGGGCLPVMSDEQTMQLFRDTVEFWRRWLSQCTYRGRWREMVYRSALTLKLLTFEPTGAIVAAPTTSLPESPGGVRNWDYRYTWIRDAAFTLYALLRIGFTEEAGHFMHWLEARCHELNPDGSLQIMYGLNGEHELPETTLDHLEGYRGSRPVRIGNAASKQMQLDIYGEMMDSVYLYNKYGTPISYDLWTVLRRLMQYVSDHWQEPDEGIWEVRGGRKQFVYSRLMCWVALDRAIRLAEKRSFPADIHSWRNCRNAIYEDIQTHGWNPTRGAFVQSYGSDVLDASVLTIPLVFFMSPTDPRMLSTLDAIMKPPHERGLLSNSLVYRYNLNHSSDGLTGDEGTFNMCTFWLVEALTRAGRLDEARLMFEEMLGYANHLGLYAEETGPSGEALGNYPQAFTHLSLISAAFNLDRALGKA